MMNYNEIWAYSYERIRAYLLDLGGSEIEGVFILPACEITLLKLPDRMVSGLAFSQTRVLISGPDADRFHHQFKLHFLSGGA